MRRSSILLACAGMILRALDPAHASEPSGHILFDVASCDNIILPGLSTTAIRALVSSEGISGVEFAVRGIPPGPDYVIVEATPHADASVEGNPFGDGVRMRFTDCKSGFITLYTITFFRTSGPAVGVQQLQIGPHGSPSDPSLTCPAFMTCGSNPAGLVCTWGTAEIPLASPADPFPADGAIGVNPDLEIRWLPPPFTYSCWLSQPMAHIFLGTDPNPPLVMPGVDYGTYRPPTLAPNTRYFWRIVVSGHAQYAESPVWTFTTGQPIGIEGHSWTYVKIVYR